IDNNHEYLKVVINIATRWDLTYKAWVRILKLKSAIEVMQLKMKDLIKVLQPFANATKMLGGSKYTTILYVFPTILSLKKLLNITYDTQVNINFDNSNTAFNDDQELKEKIDLIDKPEILDAEAYLITEYEAFKEQEPIPADTVQMNNNPDKEENVLLAAIYESI
ncbi:6900_t:CDS:2, partial [Dentiscutata erythropus]